MDAARFPSTDPAVGLRPKSVALAAIQAYADAGYDEVHVLQMGPDQAGMLRFYRRGILPHFQ